MQSKTPSSQPSTLLFASLSVVTLLVVARCLEPSPHGLGTHQQLGLPPCTSLVLWGVPCPACGMTTSWAWAVRGQWLRAADANAGGLFLAIIALAFVSTSCYCLAVRKTLAGDRVRLLLGLSLCAALALAVAQWSWRLLQH